VPAGGLSHFLGGTGEDCEDFGDQAEGRQQGSSVRFYRDVLGMELFYGGEEAGFSSLCAKDTQSAILNLEEGDPIAQWGRLIFLCFRC
jgi:hypothetical protein